MGCCFLRGFFFRLSQTELNTRPKALKLSMSLEETRYGIKVQFTQEEYTGSVSHESLLQ